MTGLELRLRESLSSERIEDISIEQLTQSVSQLIAQTYIMVGYQTYNERGLIHDTPEEKRHAMSLFAHWRPPGHLPISEDYRLTMVRQQAMAWLLRRYFDGLIAKEKA